MQTASSSTSSSRRWKYDVFLSFRGEDTRRNFVDHLYTAFNQKGLLVFRDDKELERGKPISPELLHAIEESRSAVVVFSRNYASSTWCLDELVQIVHCKDITYFPVFYHMDPSVVRKQTGEFQEAFVKHEETFREDMGKVQTWRKALTEVANHSGFDLKDRHESQFIEEIVKEISNKLRFSKYPSVEGEGLVGINSRLEKLKNFLNLDSQDVRMIGICGMGGIGKTTIARFAYDSISCEFEGSRFLANVTEISKKDGLVSLQKMLLSQILGKDDINVYDELDVQNMIRRRLSSKKVLIVIDDVNDLKQLKNLVGKHDWFGMGSRIIITSRNKRLLTSHEVDEVYEAEELNDGEALQLFISKAFKKHQPLESFRELSKRVVKYCSGLPLALEVLGGFLCGREVNVWEDALERLKVEGEKHILDILQISFDGLTESEKKIFLDIACFFKGMDRHYVTKVLVGCGFFPKIGIDILIDKSLIIILDGYKLWMHDLLQQMGQQIVYRECPEEPGKRSRLWMKEHIQRVLTKNTGTEMVESIKLNEEICFSKEQIYCGPEAFSKMINLRLLKIRNIQLPQGLDYLPEDLRLLDWKGYPLKSLPSNLKLEKIIELKMKYSRIEQLPQGIKPFNNLESIIFESCDYLIRIPDIKFAPNLKQVILSDCTRLREIHPSLLVHKKITYLDMSFCTSLTTLPNQIHMESLKLLDLFFCDKLENFPEIVGSMDCLDSISLNKTAIKVLPVTIYGLKSLKSLCLSHTAIRPPSLSSFLKTCKLPTLSGLCTSLRSLTLSGCNMEEEEIPNDFFDSFSSLQSLELGKNNFVSLPGSIKHLSELHCLYLGGCKRLRSLPELPSNINYIDVNGCVALETTSNALRLCNSKLSRISCANCLKLICCNNLASSTPREFLKAMSKLPDRPEMNPHAHKDFEMVIPGSEIPEWFQHQSETSSIKIERPPDYYDNKVVGYAVCCVFDVHEHQPTRNEDVYMISCTLERFLRHKPYIYLHEMSGKAVPDHLCLLYFSAGRLNQDFVELSFESCDRGLEVKKCGIHPVYEKEIEELQPRAKKCSSSCFWNSYELDEDFLESKADVDSDGIEDEDEIYFSADDKPRPKRLKADVDSDGVEDEDEIYFSADDEPRPKRLKSS